jgi:hypothetical protein
MTSLHWEKLQMNKKNLPKIQSKLFKSKNKI